MKKGICIMATIFLLTGCSSTPTTASTTTTSSTVATVTPTPSISTLSFDGYKQALINGGLSITETVTMAADSVGASQGTKFKFSDGTKVEIYEFDTSSDAYKTATSKGIVSMKGFGNFNVILNGTFAVLADGNSKAIEIFKSLK